MFESWYCSVDRMIEEWILNFDVDRSVTVWILVFQYGSLDSSVSIEIPICILRSLYKSWNPSVDIWILMWTLKFPTGFRKI